MKFRHSLIIGCLTALLGFGAFLGAGVSKEAKVEKAEALSNTGAAGDYIFFTPSSNWNGANADFKLNWYKDSAYKQSTYMSKVTLASGAMSEIDTYYAVAPVAFDQVQFCRMDPKNHSDSGQWNYSSNSSVSGSYRWIVMDSDRSGNSWNVGNGAQWKGPLDIVYKGTDRSPSLSTGRVFVYNSGTHWGTNGTTAVRAWGGSASSTIAGSQVSEGSIYLLNWFADDNGQWYGYTDIPTDITGYNFIKVGGNDSYDVSIAYTSNNFTADSFAYVRYAPEEGNDFTSGTSHTNSGAALMKKVIQAYSTCKKSPLNGYGAYSALNTNFYSRATSSAKAATETSLGGVSATIQEHFEGMAQSAAGTRKREEALVVPNEVGEAMPVAMTSIIVSFSAVIAAAGFIFLKKKKSL